MNVCTYVSAFHSLHVTLISPSYIFVCVYVPISIHTSSISSASLSSLSNSTFSWCSSFFMFSKKFFRGCRASAILLYRFLVSVRLPAFQKVTNKVRDKDRCMLKKDGKHNAVSTSYDNELSNHYIGYSPRVHLSARSSQSIFSSCSRISCNKKNTYIFLCILHL